MYLLLLKEITSANINNSKYMCIIVDDDEIVPVVIVFAALWTCVTIGSPRVVCGHCCCCAAAGSIVKLTRTRIITTTNTGQWEYFITPKATLPSSNLLSPDIPLVPTTTKSTLFFSAYSTIATCGMLL